MAPSVRGTSTRVSKRQASVRTNAKVSKVIRNYPILEEELEEVALKQAAVSTKSVRQTGKHIPKRKRDEVEDDSEAEPVAAPASSIKVKKAKVQLPTPPSSQRQSPVDHELSPTLTFRQLSLDPPYAVRSQEALPPVLQDFVSLHAAFLKAFSLHIVHNGQTAPANLASLSGSVTRLWKKHTVSKEDIQRMLAIYELDVTTHFSGRLLKHQEGPFKLTMTGSDYVRYTVEYVGWGSNRLTSSRWDEYNLQQLYEAEVEGLWISSRKNPNCWVHGEVRNFPKLDFAVGVQTQARRAKAEAARREILGLSTQAQNRQGAQFAVQPIKDTQDAEVQKPETVKNRTLSLLDRVRAKAVVTASAASESPDAVIRRYAVGRISEVVEILRMKQQRKLSSTFISSVHSSPSKVRSKVSFSMNQLINDIKDSLRIPLGDSEIRMCFKILESEIPGTWLSTHAFGAVQSVILSGPGLSGVKVKKILDEQMC
ncbi:hypothetical protein G647_02040 [Cladophialophora carrionii CBS 160.54]|uniref:DNA replication factor Cdt1 C-terminal domain-containing protein n=1 Tax=Cladophialophora carrionii CBS 160.54 TaxID=1279043 RepID=V9DU91_9EURO|nr:uncharacterized protein G647_02040 [Cladophialophora carrionii CBS 160.54]ETI29587.1 hypothetical protein G647_02040 [Cladophialophora carrionii CBS 160.54]